MSRYYLKNLYLMFKQEHNVVYTLKTIASAGGVSVVDKAYTTLKAFTAFTLAEVFYSEKLYLCAFTLAEVLIVLGIIGLIADMTIPTLHQNITAAVRITSVKKAHSTLENAFRLAVAENGTPDTWGATPSSSEDGNISENNAGTEIYLQKFKPYLNIAKECKAGDTCEDFSVYSLNGTKRWDASPATINNAIILADGSAISFYWVYSENCDFKRGDTKALSSICGEMAITLKVNHKKAYQGKDRFFFYLTKYGIIPEGSQAETETNGFTFENYCNMNKKGILNGYGCAAWVLYNGNMDYLKCNDLSWTDKTRCN